MLIKIIILQRLLLCMVILIFYILSIILSSWYNFATQTTSERK